MEFKKKIKKPAIIGIMFILIVALLLTHTDISFADQASRWNYKEKITVTSGAFKYSAYVSENNKECWIYRIKINTTKSHSTLRIPEKLKGKKVTRLGNRTWEGREFNRNIFGVTVERAHDVDGYAKVLKGVKKLIIPQTVTAIEPTAFSGMDYITSIKLPSGLSSIRYETFYGCYRLKTVVLPRKMEKFHNNAFYDCPNLTQISISDQNKNFEVKNGMVIDKRTKTLEWVLPRLKTVEIPEGVTAIRERALYSSTASTLSIPASLEKIEKDGLTNRKITTIKVAADNPYYALNGQCVYDKRDNSLAVAIIDSKHRLRISEKVTLVNENNSITGYALHEDNSAYPSYILDTLVVPASVTEIKGQGIQLQRFGLIRTVYFLGSNPPKVSQGAEGYSQLPIFCTVWVPEEHKDKYVQWYKEHDCLDCVNEFITGC